jgi:mono/diheme cytochrome c family protein
MERPMRIAVPIALFVALTACSHAAKTSRTTQASPGAMASAAASSAAAPTTSAGVASNGALAAHGASVYSTNCSSCHQAQGQGVSGTFPPLAGNPAVTGPAAAVITIVKDGKSGPITVKGVSYNGQMPSWKATLSNDDIAAVVTYIRSSWGNHASAVTAAQVSAAK